MASSGRSADPITMTAPIHLDRGQGPVVVLLHGVGVGPESFATLAGLLEDHHRVIVLERPGRGRGGPLPLVDQVDLIAACIRELGAAGGRLVGVSGGATLGLLLAIRHPGAVAGLVLHEPLVGPLAPELHEQFQRSAQRAIRSDADAMDVVRTVMGEPDLGRTRRRAARRQPSPRPPGGAPRSARSHRSPPPRASSLAHRGHRPADHRRLQQRPGSHRGRAGPAGPLRCGARRDPGGRQRRPARRPRRLRPCPSPAGRRSTPETADAAARRRTPSPTPGRTTVGSPGPTLRWCWPAGTPCGASGAGMPRRTGSAAAPAGRRRRRRAADHRLAHQGALPLDPIGPRTWWRRRASTASTGAPWTRTCAATASPTCSWPATASRARSTPRCAPPTTGATSACWSPTPARRSSPSSPPRRPRP